MSRTRLAAAAAGLVVVACLATAALTVGTAVGAPPEPRHDSPSAHLSAPPEPGRGLLPVTTPPAPAPSALAEAARAAAEVDATPPCALTRDLTPDGSRLRAKPVTSADSRQGCPQSRALPLQGAP
jgi:hypothetical protein